jgi:hypothetical protein
MAPTRTPTTSSGGQPKKQQSVLMLQEKLAVLVSNVVRKYGCNNIYIHITEYIKNHVLYGRFKGFSMVILTISDFGFTRRP